MKKIFLLTALLAFTGLQYGCNQDEIEPEREQEYDYRPVDDELEIEK